MLSVESRRTAESELNEPPADEARAVLARFAERVTEAIGAEAAQRFDWAQLATLRQSKWDTDKALARMQKLAEFAKKNAQYFDGLEAAEFVDQARLGMTSHLPTRTSRGELVMLIDGVKLKDYAKSYTMRDMLRFSVFYMSLLMHDEETQVHGAIIVENLDLNDDQVKSEAKFIDDLGADSLDITELLMALEDEFNIDIDDDANEIATVGDAVNYITSKL